MTAQLCDLAPFVLEDARAVCSGAQPKFSAATYRRATLFRMGDLRTADENFLETYHRLRAAPTPELALLLAAYFAAWDTEHIRPSH